MFYNIARVVCRLILLLVRRWEVVGRENMPSDGGLVIVSNHMSFWDPVIIGCAFGRKVSYMGKEELFNINPIFTWLIRQLRTFPVKRGQLDRAAIRFALEHLCSGNIIGLFPEGTRSKSGDLQEARNGAAMLAIKAGVPVLPVGIIGSKGWGKVKVNVGQPIETTDWAGERLNKEVLNSLSTKFMTEIDRLLSQKQEKPGDK